MKTTKVYNGNYQRNGVSGEGFFSAMIDFKEDKTANKGFLITFTVDEITQAPDRYNCRVIDPQNPRRAWRWDVFADELNYFFKQKTTDIYGYLNDNKN